MNIGTKLMAVFVSLSGILSLFVGLGLPGIQAAHDEALVHYDAPLQAVDLARRAQVNFKLQLQDWTDILLRGHDPAAYKMYYDSFVQQESLTQKELSGLKVLLAGTGQPANHVAAALQAHLELGTKYRAALTCFSLTNQQTSAMVDRLVLGVDRPVAGEIDGIVADLSEFAETASAAAAAQIHAQTQTIRITTAFALVTGIFASVMFGVFLSTGVIKPARIIAGSLSNSLRQSAAVPSHASRQFEPAPDAGGDHHEMPLDLIVGLGKNSSGYAPNAGFASTRKPATANHAVGIKTVDGGTFQTNARALDTAVEAAS